MQTNVEKTTHVSKKIAAALGIAAEYNPFHNGHSLHIFRARELLNSEGLGGDAPVVATLSSSFTQRGLPALSDKWTRTRMALANGVDLVLELPFVYACNAAPEFARGAVDTLASVNFVTHLSFGMESLKNPNFEIGTILNILIQEPLSFKLNLKKNLALGQSYPKAVADALDRELPGSGCFISSPNNSLAFSYLLHVRRRAYGLIPLPVQREGSGYHDGAAGPLASATAIRAALKENWIEAAMPASSFALLREEEARGRLCMGTEKLWTLLRGLLSRSSPEELQKCAGMDEGMEHLFLNHYAEAESYEDFIGRCVSRRYTRSRLQRQTIRLLVGVDRWTAAALRRKSPPYVRVLGYNTRGRELLRNRNGEAGIPFLTRLQAGRGAVAKLSAEVEFRASRLWELLLPEPDLSFEERQRPVDFCNAE